MSITQAARELGCSRPHVYKLIRAGLLTPVPKQSNIKITEPSLIPSSQIEALRQMPPETVVAALRKVPSKPRKRRA